ncbi:alpha/beta fold hydrolase [Undibacterium sp. Jales W-56]|uniref:YheT family hydrolase n=1 Tax=Undibacterium sp. Jales W-56 TaxID=2897325 RepID=UPI0021D29126|nr:alpha/beta fold hydrolase [Undibacterium sp. Jales W-56]MCU6434546.1 alpha/beta fold hydrolase [Undibacterium sp. Jales W-56]
MHYIAPRWLPSGHLQTIYPALYISKPEVAFRRERWDTPDGDFIDVDFVDGAIDQPFVVMFHGLEGSSDSHYARALMALLQEQGWSGAVPHFRGCSGELNQAPRFYHSGDAQEIAWVVQKLHQQFRARQGSGKFYASGVSLGGNALLRWLGESPQQASIVDAACAISAPLDLAQGGASLSSGFNMVYTKMFLKTLKPKCLQKLHQFPGLFNRDAMLNAKNLYEFDNVVTAPLHGYLDTEDYWNRASAKHVLEDIRVPTLVMNAQNDPFLPGQHLPRKASKHVTLDYPKHGGHVGFAVGSLPGSIRWLPQKILHFFEQDR